MIRSAIKAGLKKILGVEVKTADAAPAPMPPAWRAEPPPAPAVVEAPAPVAEAAPPAPSPAVEAPAPVAEAAPAPAPATEVEAAPVAEAAPAKAPKKKKAPAKKAPAKGKKAAAEAAPPAPVEATDDTAGAAAFTFEQVQELMDEMVRPALQGDGGDITLVKIEKNDVYVRLVGACSTCPSSIMTMKMGIEALLREELPGFGNLIQVDAA